MNNKTIFIFILSLLILALPSVYAQELNNQQLLNKYYNNMDELDIKKIEKEKQEKGMRGYTAHYDIADSCYVDIQESIKGQSYSSNIRNYKNPTIISKSYYKSGELKFKGIAYWMISNVYGDYYLYDKSGNIIETKNPTAQFTFTLDMLIEKIKHEYEVDLWDLSTKTGVSFLYHPEHPTYEVIFNRQLTPKGYFQGKCPYRRIIVDAKTGKTLKVSGSRRGELIDPPKEEKDSTKQTRTWSPLMD